MLTSDGKEPEGQALTFKEGKKGGVQITNSHQGEIIAIRIDTKLFRRSCSRNKHWNDFKNLIVEVTTICSSYEKRELVLLNGGGYLGKNANAVQMSRRRCRRRHVDTKEICTVPTFLAYFVVKLRYVRPDIARSTNCAK
jgi:hypothetical protein